MSADSSFAELIRRMRQGDQTAFTRVFEAYTRRLIGLAAHRLDKQIRRKEDPEEVAQEALWSFFRRDRANPFNLETWEDLWSLLAVITMRKCGHKVEYYLAEAIARDPTAEEVAAFKDTVCNLVGRMEEGEREIVQLVLEGFSVQEISKKTNRTEYLIRRTIRKVRDRWQASEG
jgi:RNA polymerase sigma-70 factor, ECF subfamily